MSDDSWPNAETLWPRDRWPPAHWAPACELEKAAPAFGGQSPQAYMRGADRPTRPGSHGLEPTAQPTALAVLGLCDPAAWTLVSLGKVTRRP